MATYWVATREDASTITLDQTGFTSPYIVTQFDVHTAPDIRDGDEDSIEGQVGGLDLDSGRPMSLNVSFAADRDSAQFRLDFERLLAFFQTSWQSIYLAWFENGVERIRVVRARGVTDTSPDDVRYGNEVQIKLRALDPRTYGPPITVTVDDATTVAHGGERDTREWLFTVAGPVTNPTFTAPMTAGTMEITSSVVVASGSTWEVDGRTGDIRVVDGAGNPDYDFLSTRISGGQLATVQPIKAGSAACTFTSTAGATTGQLTILPAY